MNIISDIPEIWWKSAVIYQIYPRSFYDADDNGVGDLKGITQKLDYLNDGKGGGLGIDAIWLSPFFRSPMKDFGYDISDYCDVDPIFGTLLDFEELVNAAHQRGIKVLIDLVLNHCSDQHPWFRESRKDRTNPKANWFIWRDKPKNQTYPNNWLSIFGGSAWTFDENRQQYYLHNFLKEQPDLNWYNPEVRAAIQNIIRFWLNKNVDGFRLDTANFYAYDLQFRNNPRYPEGHISLEARDGVEFDQYNSCFSKDRPENFECLKLIRSTMDEIDPTATTIGEIGGVQDLNRLIDLATSYVKGNQHLHMAYTFSLLGSNINSFDISNIVETTESCVEDGWPCWSFGNHDCPRIRTRCDQLISPDFYQNVMLLLLCLRGTPIIYYGDELGMLEYNVKKEELQDPFGIEYWPKYAGRDGCRTPFPWDNRAHNQGFSKTAKPWLPTTSQVDFKNQEFDKKSMYQLTREMLRIRKSSKALRSGQYLKIDSKETIYHFQRMADQEVYQIVCNFGSESYKTEIDHKDWKELVLHSFNRNGSLKDKILNVPPFGFSILKALPA
jgi:alpha-glucosidase